MTEDHNPSSKADLLTAIQSERARFESLIDDLDESQMTKTGVGASWSIKDILAHIAAWERLAQDRIHAALSGEPLKYPLISGDEAVDKFNADVYEKNKDRPLEDVAAEFHESYGEFIAQIEGLDDNFLTSPLPFDWAGKLTAQVLISANTHWHYNEHAESIQKWMDKQG